MRAGQMPAPALEPHHMGGPGYDDGGYDRARDPHGGPNRGPQLVGAYDATGAAADPETHGRVPGADAIAGRALWRRRARRARRVADDDDLNRELNAHLRARDRPNQINPHGIRRAARRARDAGPAARSSASASTRRSARRPRPRRRSPARPTRTPSRRSGRRGTTGSTTS